MRSVLTLLVLAALASCVRAQTWNPLDHQSQTGERRISLKQSRDVTTSGNELRSLLFSAPHEKTVTAETSPVTLVLPLPGGGRARYRIVAYDIAEAPALAKYPNIRTWYGVNADLPTQTVFLDWTERGFHASVRGGGTESFFIDPISRRNTDNYQVYRKSDFDPDLRDYFSCGTAAGNRPQEEQPGTSGKALGDCELMQYRTTITATGEYSNYHGATSAAQSGLVQSAVVTTVNRVNQVFTRDISVRLQLVANNDELYKYTPGAAPFQDNTVGALVNQNTSYTDGIIGRDNYDYGHIFTRGTNNGVAYLRASCVSSIKAGGATSRSTPEADPFDIDYVAHEMGHNFGGNHTQNNDCNYSSSAGMEPGSASSIMGYAGICSPNVQTNSDAYFHGRSIEEITTHFEFGNGGCGTIINTSLNNATVTAQTDETIPAGTPFVLKSGASGSGGITYNWEQYDPERGAAMPPAEDNAQGPLFRSFEATTSPERFFPNLPAVVGGDDPMWEELPMVSREMNFRATVLNQSAAYGCASEDDVTITVNASGRPFTVSDPNNGNQWSAGQTAQVRWDVAGTNSAPYNSQLVDVVLSTNGGANWQTLLTNTPNDGFAEVSVPAQTSSAARIMVRSKDNVFFNVSEEDFTIVSAAGTAAIGLSSLGPTSVTDCFGSGGSADFSFLTSSSGGATAPITWSVGNLPNGVSPVFSANPVRPGGSFTVSLTGLENMPNGTNQFTLSGSSSEGTLTETLSVTKLSGGNQSGPSTIAPAGSEVDLRPVLRAAAAGDATYDLQLSTSPTFATLLYNLAGADVPELSVPDYLEANTVYYWRVRSSSSCGTSAWTESRFVTADCRVFSSSSAPVTISDGTAPQFAAMPLSVPFSGTITDVDLFEMDIDHTYISDMRIDLTHPNGSSVRVWDRACTFHNNMFISFDDESPTATIDCPPVSGGFFPSPVDPLSGLDGLDAAGTWTLNVTDLGNADGGAINAFSVKLCLTNAALPVTFLSFAAEGKKDHIALDWATETERDNYGFFVERNQVGADAGAWAELGFVAAGAEYAFADRTALPHTDYLYRLRQQDLDGRVAYGEVRTARFGEATGAVSLYPNPTSGKINFRLAGGEDDLPYDLIDVNGRTLASGVLSAAGGALNLSDKPAGVYFVRVAGTTHRIVRL